MTSPFDIAIVVIAYNRKDTLAKLLTSLNSATYQTDNITLIISVDKSDTNAVADYAENFSWLHGEKLVFAHKERLGLRKHILSTGDLLNTYDAIVVLEDDLIVSPCFFLYAQATVSKYFYDDDVAGISLYAFPVNNYNYWPFHPIKNEYDVYFMNIAQSWGQIWMKRQWKAFIDWYQNHDEEFGELPHLPKPLSQWPKTSWLKYHNKYCIENDKYFVYPYQAMSTNSGAPGSHSSSGSNLFQTYLQYGKKEHYSLPDKITDGIRYDGFFENKDISDYLGINDLCVDIYTCKLNREHKRFWLTTTVADYKIVKSFAIQLLPLEVNVLRDNLGEGLFLFDTGESVHFTGTTRSYKVLCNSLFHSKSSLLFLYLYGFKNVIKDFSRYLKRKITTK